ncbi:MAG: hypothetical protein ACREA0_23135 [bacterium]
MTIEQVKVEVDGSLMNKIIGDIVSSLWDALKAWLTEQGKDKLDFSTQELATKPDDAKERIFQESQGLLDGEWLGEVKFMIVNIAGRLAIQSAQAVYRETHRPTKPPTHEPPKPKLPTPKVPKPDGGPRHEP